MKRLISLDFASQETYVDTVYALRTIFDKSRWEGQDALSRVRSSFAQLIYQGGHQRVWLFLSGRSALKAVLESLHLPKDSKVAIQAFTCTAVALPVVASGLDPVYIDINRDDFSMNIDDLKAKYTDSVRVVILQHSFGITPSSRDAIIDFCEEHDVFLIEDMAHGFPSGGLPHPNERVRSCALVSFGRSKLLSSVFGAAIISSYSRISQSLDTYVDRLSQPPRIFVLQCLLYKILTPLIKDTYSVASFGRLLHWICIRIGIFPDEVSQMEKAGSYDARYEYAYPEALAQTLIPQIEGLPSRYLQAQKRGEEYRNALSHESPLSHSTPPHRPLLRYPYLVKDPQDREHILRHFGALDILLGTWYDQPVGPSGINLNLVRYAGGCPVAEEVCKSIINLPLSLDDTSAQEVVRGIRQVINPV